MVIALSGVVHSHIGMGEKPGFVVFHFRIHDTDIYFGKELLFAVVCLFFYVVNYAAQRALDKFAVCFMNGYDGKLTAFKS